jgi:hypothetical protein
MNYALSRNEKGRRIFFYGSPRKKNFFPLKIQQDYFAESRTEFISAEIFAQSSSASFRAFSSARSVFSATGTVLLM